MRSLTLIAVPFLFAAAPVSAATIVQETEFLWDLGGLFAFPERGEKSAALTLFDPTLGTLRSVGVTVKADAALGFLLSTTVPTTMVTSGSANLIGFQHSQCCFPAYRLPLPTIIFGPSSRELPDFLRSVYVIERASGSGYATYSDSLDRYVGVGTIGINSPKVSLRSDAYDPSGTLLRTVSGDGSARGVITYVYNYDPTSAVPDAPTWMTLIVGFGALGIALRSDRSKALKLG